MGERVLIGGQVGIVGHVEIGDDTAIGAQSGVSKNISGGTWLARRLCRLRKLNNKLPGSAARKTICAGERD